MREWMTVIKFTFVSRMRTKAFRTMIVIFALVLTALLNLPAIIAHFSSHEADRIGVFDSADGIAAQLEEYFDKQPSGITIVRLNGTGSPEANEQLAKSKIEAKEIKGYVEFAGIDQTGFPKAIYKSTSSSDLTLKSKLQAALQSVKLTRAVGSLGLPPAEAAKLSEPVSVESVQISVSAGTEGKSESEIAAAYALVYVLLMLLYVGVLGCGNMVATEITAEKNSRVMEVLIASVSPLKQMFGKIIGICLLGLVQIAVIVAVAAANLQLPHNREMAAGFHVDLSKLPVSLLVYFVIFYIGGYLIYATIFAAVGSLVSRTEDVGQAIMPVTFLIIAAFMIAMFGLQKPDAPFVAVASHIPFFSPLIMFLRIGMGDPAGWEIGLSIVILVGSIAVLGWLAAKIYRTGVLMYGKRPSLKELRKAMKAYKVQG